MGQVKVFKFLVENVCFLAKYLHVHTIKIGISANANKSFGIFITHSLTNSTLVGSAGGILTMGAAPGPGAAGAGGGGGRIAATGVVATGAEGTAGAGGGATGIAPEK